jgi:hypothetical protein
VVFIKLARTLDYLNISILHFIFTVKWKQNEKLKVWYFLYKICNHD